MSRRESHGEGSARSTPATILPSLFTRRRRWLLIRLILNGLVQAGIAITLALLVERAFSLMIGASGAAAAPGDGGLSRTPVMATLLLLVLARGVLLRIETADAERVGQLYVGELRQMLAGKVLRMSPRLLQSRSHGGSLLRFTGDLTAVRNWVSQGVARLLVAGTMIVGVLAILAFRSPAIALVLAVILAAGGATTVLCGREVDRRARESRRDRSALAANTGQILAASATVQAFGQTRREERRIRKQSSRLRRSMIRRARANGNLRATADITANLGTISVIALGLAIVPFQSVAPGEVVGAMTLVGLLVTPIRDLGRVERYRRDARVASEKVAEVLNRPDGLTPRVAGAAPEPGPGAIIFRDIRVPGIIEHLSAEIPPQTLTVIVGPNGAGKSTLLELAAGLIEPASGDILIDGVPSTSMSRGALHEAIAVAGPQVPLLRGSVSRNLRYRTRDVPDEERERIWALCGIPDLLAELPAGDRTRLSDGGANLSSGQRQRIMLARALLGTPRILLLDEADANLDPVAVAVLGRVLDQFVGTVLFVTHRRDWIERADAVWHLDSGRLVERGPPRDILSGDGPTARLFAHAPVPLAS